jgi:4-diphosphocytidyl-2-C-methyl-D-erythritol kinase
VRFRDLAALAGGLANNMILASETLVPAIGEALGFLRAQDGVLGATMAGSGSAVFAICASASDAERIATLAEQRGWWAAATATSAAGATVTESEV